MTPPTALHSHCYCLHSDYHRPHLVNYCCLLMIFLLLLLVLFTPSSKSCTLFSYNVNQVSSLSFPLQVQDFALAFCNTPFPALPSATLASFQFLQVSPSPPLHMRLPFHGFLFTTFITWLTPLHFAGHRLKVKTPTPFFLMTLIPDCFYMFISQCL